MGAGCKPGEGGGQEAVGGDEAASPAMIYKTRSLSVESDICHQKLGLTLGDRRGKGKV